MIIPARMVRLKLQMSFTDRETLILYMDLDKCVICRSQLRLCSMRTKKCKFVTSCCGYTAIHTHQSQVYNKTAVPCLVYESVQERSLLLSLKFILRLGKLQRLSHFLVRHTFHLGCSVANKEGGHTKGRGKKNSLVQQHIHTLSLFYHRRNPVVCERVRERLRKDVMRRKKP